MKGTDTDTLRVLHVDSDTESVRGFESFVESDADGMEVLTSHTGSEALELLGHGVDCVVSGYTLDGEDGLDGIGLLRRTRELYPDLPFILFTGSGDEETASRAIDAGVTGYIPKKETGSSQYEFLANRVRDAVGKRKAEEEASRERMINTVVREINQILVRSTDREEIETKVCDYFSDWEGSDSVWVHRSSTVSGSEEDRFDLTPAADGGDGSVAFSPEGLTSHGCDSGYSYEEAVETAVESDEGVETVETYLPLPPVSRRASETGVDTDVDAGVDTDVDVDTRREPEGSLTVIPITYGDSLYGVLSIWSDDPDGFRRRERKMLGQLGKDIGGAIDSVELRDDLRRFKRAVDSAGLSVLITDDEGVIEYVNPRFEEMTGYSEEEAVGETPSILKSGEHDESFYDEMWETVGSGETWHGEIINKSKSGELYHVSQAIAPILRDGETEGFVGINREVTHIKHRRQQLQVLQRILRHNLRNAVSQVYGYADMIADSPCDDDYFYSEMIRQKADELTDLSRKSREIEKITQYADTGRRTRETPATPTDTDIADIVRRQADEISEKYPNAEIDVVSPETARVSKSANLSVGVRELIENAVEHSSDTSPSVEVRVSKGSETVEVEVKDDAGGVPEYEKEVLRNGEETSLLHGSGLGLWLVHWSVVNSGGKTEIEETSEEKTDGTCVRICLPTSTTS